MEGREYYIGCDVSMKAISVCVMEKGGKVLLRKDIAASPEALYRAVKEYLPSSLVGLEAGSTSSWLYHGLEKLGVKVVCLETHHARKVLSAQPVKTDRNDAEGLAQLLRTGWYKKVHVKEEDTQELKAWLEARETLKHKQQDIKNTIRGLVKPFGFILPEGCGHSWIHKVKERLKKERPSLEQMIAGLLAVYGTICDHMAGYDKFLENYAKKDEVCKRLQTIDGVGPINAFAFKALIEDPERFESSRDVGAYFGLTPKLYASGELEIRGKISKCGSGTMRALLYEAAQALLTRVKHFSTLKSWGMRLRKKKPHGQVVTALARKLAVLMLAMWKNGTTFQRSREKTLAVLAG